MALAIVYVAAAVVAMCGPLVYFHTALHGLSLLQVALSLFCAVNVVVCWWEIGLFFNIALIKSQYNAFKKELKNELPSPMFLFTQVSFREAITLKYWALVWSTYSILDPSYSDHTTFGYFVDVGNGFTTLLPSIAFAVCMTWPLLPARPLGVVCLVKFYQEAYGTVMYFWSFIQNKRYVGKRASYMSVVIISNMIWIIFPAYGLYASYRMLDESSYSVFRSS